MSEVGEVLHVHLEPGERGVLLFDLAEVALLLVPLPGLPHEAVLPQDAADRSDTGGEVELHLQAFRPVSGRSAALCQDRRLGRGRRSVRAGLGAAAAVGEARWPLGPVPVAPLADRLRRRAERTGRRLHTDLEDRPHHRPAVIKHVVFRTDHGTILHRAHSRSSSFFLMGTWEDLSCALLYAMSRPHRPHRVRVRRCVVLGHVAFHLRRQRPARRLRRGAAPADAPLRPPPGRSGGRPHPSRRRSRLGLGRPLPALPWCNYLQARLQFLPAPPTEAPELHHRPGVPAGRRERGVGSSGRPPGSLRSPHLATLPLRPILRQGGTMYLRCSGTGQEAACKFCVPTLY